MMTTLRRHSDADVSAHNAETDCADCGGTGRYELTPEDCSGIEEALARDTVACQCTRGNTMNSVLHNPKAFADRLYGSRLFDDCGLMAFAQRREANVQALLRSLREQLPTHEAALKTITQLDDAATDYACAAHAEGLQLGIAIERSRQAIVAAAAEKEE